MKKAILFVLGICLALDGVCYANYPMGNFIARRGPQGEKGTDGTNGTNGTNGADCNPSETRVRCGPNLSVQCYENNVVSQKTGVKIERSSCPAGGSPIVSYLFDNECGVTVNTVTDVHEDNDLSKPVTHKRVTFKNTCTNAVLSEEADIPVGQDGNNCDAGVEVTPCSPSTDVKCGANGSANASRTGVRIRRKACDGTIDSSFAAQYILHGDDGTSFNYLGTVANCNALPTSPTPSVNDAYLVKGTGLGRVCIYTGNGWPTCPDDCAEFTGPAGDNNCTGLETSLTAVKNTILNYTGPSKSSNDLPYYTTKGKMVTSYTPCNPNATLEDSLQEDPCELIKAPSGSTCTGSKKAYYECKTQAAAGSLAKGAIYNLCVSTTGDSIADALDAAAAAVDPCTGLSAEADKVARTKSTSRTYSAPNGGTTRAAVSYTTVARNTCSTTMPTETTYEYDTCKEIPQVSGTCSGNDKAYLECTDQTKATNAIDRTYNVCQIVPSNTSLSNKVETAVTTATNAASQVSNKLDANALTVGSDGTLKYGTSCSTNTAGVTTVRVSDIWYRKYAVYTSCGNDTTANSKLRVWLDNFCSQNGYAWSYISMPGTTNCYSYDFTGSANEYTFDLYVKIGGDDIVHPDNIGDVVSNKITDEGVLTATNIGAQLTTGGALENVVTTSNLADSLANDTGSVSSFGTGVTFNDVMEVLHAITGNCTVSNNNVNGAVQRTVSCNNGELGKQLNVDRQIGTATP